MLEIDPTQISTGRLHAYMLSCIAPRPIAFVSSVSKSNQPNLAPFSFFNAFGSNPPLLVFSPARRVRDNTIKHTLENVREVPEVVINVVSFSMVQQASLASCEYPKGINEFRKAGFTELKSSKVKPHRVKESPVQIECKVKEIVETGSEGGAGNLVVCEILLMHIAESVVNKDGYVDQDKLDLVGRLGGDWYCRASGQALFQVTKPNQKLGIGIDQLPEEIRNSNVLTGNNLGQLGNVDSFPTSLDLHGKENSLDEILEMQNQQEKLHLLHTLAKKELDKGNVDSAWSILLYESWKTKK